MAPQAKFLTPAKIIIKGPQIRAPLHAGPLAAATPALRLIRAWPQPTVSKSPIVKTPQIIKEPKEIIDPDYVFEDVTSSKNWKYKICLTGHTVIHYRPKLREFLRFPLNRNFGWDFICFL
jgi:hypothetical protein